MVAGLKSSGITKMTPLMSGAMAGRAERQGSDGDPKAGRPISPYSIKGSFFST